MNIAVLKKGSGVLKMKQMQVMYSGILHFTIL